MNTKRFWRALAVAASGFLALTFGISTFPHPPAQPAATASSVQQFTGTWTALHDGTPIIVIELHLEKGKLVGAMRVCSFRTATEGDGEFVEITDPALTDSLPVHNLGISGQSLSFDWKDPDGDVNHWKLEMTGKDAGRLNWIGLPNGLKAAPIPVTKEAATAPNSRRHVDASGLK
jgi:hypothetical protein